MTQRRWTQRDLADLVAMEIADSATSLVSGTAGDLLRDADLLSLTLEQREHLKEIQRKDPTRRMEVFLRQDDNPNKGTDGMQWIDEVVKYVASLRKPVNDNDVRRNWNKKTYRYFRPIGPPEDFDFDSYAAFICKPIYQFMEWLNDTFVGSAKAIVYWPDPTCCHIGNKRAWHVLPLHQTLAYAGRQIGGQAVSDSMLGGFFKWENVHFVTEALEAVVDEAIKTIQALVYTGEECEAILGGALAIRTYGRKGIGTN